MSDIQVSGSKSSVIAVYPEDSQDILLLNWKETREFGVSTILELKNLENCSTYCNSSRKKLENSNCFPIHLGETMQILSNKERCN